MTLIIAYSTFIMMGLVIGMMGSGGTILTVPILVYLFHIDPNLATSYSLVIVGITSSIGAFTYIKNKSINLKIAILFSLPSILSVYFTRSFIVPNLPASIQIHNTTLIKSQYIMILFSILMLAAFYSTIRSYLVKNTKINLNEKKYYGLIPLEAIFIGFLTGLVGAGGGFLIIPSLMLLNKLTIKEAIGTSLLLISINSFTGFISDPHLNDLNYTNIMYFAFLAIGGVFIGSKLNHLLNPEKLKLGFGFFILTMGICILCKELLLNVN